jgi:hypothetical protein
MEIGHTVKPTSIRARLIMGLGWLLTATVAGEAGASIICNGDCSPIGWVPEHNGNPFQFELALAAEEGQNLSLYSDGGIYVHGDINASGDIALQAENSIWLNASIHTDSNLHLGSGDPIPGGIDPGPGGIIIVGGGLSGTAAGVVIALCALDPTCEAGGADTYTATGDIYLDAAGIQLSQLSLEASFIHIDSTPVAFIPEPGTALLVGLGLVGIAVWRREGAEAERRG